MYEKNELTDVVRDFISIMKENNLGRLYVKNDKFEVELGEKQTAPVYPSIPPMPPQSAAVPAQGVVPVSEKSECGKFIRSPIVGTFYASSAPGKPPYVTIGKKVCEGDVVFIIESMKLMNEVKSEISGTVAEILVSDGEAVEYDQPILRLE